jgi:limonene-1,2-epoxide hydrolase
MSETASALHETDGHTGAGTEPTEVVRRFLSLLGSGDLDTAVDLLTPDVEYINVSLPTIRGRERVRRALRMAFRLPGAGFEVYIHKMAADTAGTVLTERTDVLLYGPVRIQIWVCGRFDVANGAILLWRDYFDFWNFTLATLRGLLGAVVPPLRAKPPAVQV